MVKILRLRVLKLERLNLNGFQLHHLSRAIGLVNRKLIAFHCYTVRIPTKTEFNSLL